MLPAAFDNSSNRIAFTYSEFQTSHKDSNQEHGGKYKTKSILVTLNLSVYAIVAYTFSHNQKIATHFDKVLSNTGS